MSQDDRDRIARLERIVAANGINVSGPNPDGTLEVDLAGDDALEHLDANGSSLALLAQSTNQRIANHEAAHPGASTVADHLHVPGGVTQ